MLQEIQVRGGVKKRPHPSGGGADFFWNNPFSILTSAVKYYATRPGIVHEFKLKLKAPVAHSKRIILLWTI